MDIEGRLARENCEGCATSCILSSPSCPFGQAAAGERRAELAAEATEHHENPTPLVD
ncbi:hypothetical protein VJ918_06070 [Adlercreutzia sp. R21]|uniref:4Fe-4S ferredoxin-type domain-containing protein n=1 Tax=Adlercreutzia wanghongyangiae TaxID=3111451 RepID=A0ABU6IIJ4_9ACTN|nr:hypothetical protein [Adlercreutzia sp. R21]MEC4176294.1 hypothetical protein [Adlercreutzia sp. R7]MEC4184375.1 hypothetical protein [Adlercreutzia sp. R21]